MAHGNDPRPARSYPLSRSFRHPGSLPAPATFVEGAKLASRLWASPSIQRDCNEIQVAPLAQGLRGMHEYQIAFSAHSCVAAFCPPSLQDCSFDHLIEFPPDEVHIGCQVGKVYRIVLQEKEAVYAILVVLLEFTRQAGKKTRRDAPEPHRQGSSTE